MTAAASMKPVMQAQRRFLAIWFPFLPADRIIRQAGAAAQDKPPLVVTANIKGALRLDALGKSAKRLGLVEGMTLADARSRFPDLWVMEADPAADAALLAMIADDCERFTPVVMMDAPDGVLLDITGCAHFHGDESGLRLAVSRRFRRAGIHARTVIAGHPDTARTLARFGRIAIVPSGSEREAVQRLPVAALNLPEKDKVALSRAGLKTIGALAERADSLFAARFGESMVTRLRRVQGLAPSPLSPRRVAPQVWVEQRFAEPIARSEDVEAVLRGLIDEACARLAERSEGGRAFEAALHRADGVVRRLIIETGRPVRTAAPIVRLFHERMETLNDPVDPGFGFDLIRLCVVATEPLEALQVGMDGRSVEREAVADLGDRLSTRFGPERVLQFEAANSHHPAAAVRAVPVVEARATPAAWPRPEAGEPPLRPLSMFDPPQRVSVSMAEVPDGPPRRFTWRRKVHAIVRAEGPERIASEWWRAQNEPLRDYYRVEDADGRRFWLFRAGEYGATNEEPRWYLHGIFA